MRKKFERILFLLSMIPALWGCTVAIPEVSMNSELKGNMVSITSGEVYSVATLPTCSSELVVSGQCDQRVTKLNMSLDEKSSWVALKEYGVGNDGDCSDGNFKVKFDDICSVLKVGAGENISKTILFQGDFQLGSTSIKSVTVNFESVESSDVHVSVQDAVVVPEGTSAQFTVSLDRASKNTVTVNYSTSSGTAQASTDYTETSGIVTFNPGETSKQVLVPTLVDTVYETIDENFSLTLMSPTNAALSQDQQAVGAISNTTARPTIQFANTGQAVNEGVASGVAVVTVSADNSATQDMFVTFGVSGSATVSNDYTLSGGLSSILIPAGATTGTLTVNIVNDAIIEGGTAETIVVSIGSETSGVGQLGGFGLVHTISISDDDIPMLSISDASGSEGNNLVFTVSLSHTSASPVTVNWNTVSGTATSGVGGDFVSASGTVNIAAGNNSTTISIPVLSDGTICEANENFSVSLSAPSGAGIADGSGEGSIIDNERPAISVNSATVFAENATGTGITVNLAQSCPNFDVTFDWVLSAGSATSGADYTSSSGSGVTISAGNMGISIPISIIDDSIDEPIENFSFTISNPTNATLGGATSSVTITDNDVPSAPTSIALSAISSPNKINNPTFNVGGVNNGDVVKIYKDSDCLTPFIGQQTSTASTVSVQVTSVFSTEGIYNIYAKRTNTDSETSACSSVFANYHYLRLDILPVYNNAASWNSYMKNIGSNQFSVSDVSPNICTGAEAGGYSACIHGGEKRKVVLPGVSGCSGLTMTDNLNVFNWVCDGTGPSPVFYSKGLRTGKGLSDLLNGASWAPLSVSLFQNGAQVLVGNPSTTVWSNNVVSLTTLAGNHTLNAAGTIYVVNSNITVDGININADRVSLVVHQAYSVTISPTASSSNCRFADGEAGSDIKCLVFTGDQKFLWVEGAFNGENSGNSVDYNIKIHQTVYSRFHNILAYYSTASGVYLESSSNNLISGLRLAYHENIFNMNEGALKLYNSNFNSFFDITATNNNYGDTAGGLSAAILVETSQNNSFVRVLAASNYCHGIRINGSSANNTIAFSNVINNGNVASCDGIKLAGTTNTLLNNILSIENSGAGIHMATNSGTKGALLFSRQNDGNGIVDLGAVSTYHYKTIVNSCSSSGSSPGLANSTCAAQNGSTTVVSSGPTVSALSFVGSMADGLNPFTGNSVPLSSLSSAFDYLRFQNPLRLWQKSVTFGDSGLCIGGSCVLWDYSLHPTIDTGLKTFEGYSPTFVALSTCPSTVDGNTTLSNGVSTFLSSAIEIMSDSEGDDDGLCETNEVCAYAPSAGAFQSYHDPLMNLGCTFSNGTVSGVTMLGVHPTVMNGVQIGAGLTLLNGNLTVQKKTGAAVSSSRAELGKNSGQWYFEVKIEKSGSNSLINSTIGIGTIFDTLSNFVGSATYGYGFDGNSVTPKFYNDNTATTSLVGFGEGDVIGVAIDLTNSKMWYSVNGAWIQGSPASGTAPIFNLEPTITYYPMVSIKNAGASSVPVVYALNFGQSLFKYPVPAGFNPGWY